MTRQPQLIPMGIGERLRTERMEQGLSTFEVSVRLRIDEPVIIALEADRLGHLAPLYQRGYVRNYARYLGFDNTEIEQMLDSMESQQPELHTVFPAARSPNAADRWLKATSYILASLLISTLAWQFTHEAVRLSQKNPDSVSGADEAMRPPGAGNPGNSEVSAGARHVNASIASPGSIEKKPVVVNGAGQGAWAALRQAQSAAQTESGLYLLDLTTSGDSWVEITDAGGQQLELDLIRGGTRKGYKGVPPFNIQLGRASAVTLYLNGAEVDLGPFTQGDVTQMILPAPAENDKSAGTPVPARESGGG